MNKLQQMLGAMGEGVGRVDDYVQGGIRDHILRLPNDGKQLDPAAKMSALREILGAAVNQHRNPDSKTYYSRSPGKAEFNKLLGARAAQVGVPVGVTAAGAALMNTGDQIREASKPQFEPLPTTERDQLVMEDVRAGLEDGSLSEIELNAAAKNGAFTKPQLALISDIYDFSRLGQEYYPFGEQTIVEAIFS